MTGIWTITYGGVEKAAADWGLTARPVIKTRDRSPTSFSFRMHAASPETAIPFPFKSQVIIKQNRTYAGGAWSGSGYVFTGYQTTQAGDVDGRSQGVTMVFKDALWLLQNTTFQQLWKQNTATGGGGSPTVTSVPVSRCVLFMDINSWVPNTYQSVQWQIHEIISYAASCGIAIAAGTIDYSGWFLNYYHCRAVSCWDALLKCLEPIPDAKVWVDGSTATPTLQVRTRANIAALASPAGTGPGPITLPYRGQDAAGRRHVNLKNFTPRYDLIPPQVVLQYQINNTVNGQAAPTFTSDVYPASVGGITNGQIPFAMVCPIDLTGSANTTEQGTLDCEALACVGVSHAAARAWWASKRGGEQAKLADFRVRFGANTIGDATVTDDTGAAINLANYPNRIVKGTYHAWMKNGSTQINAIRAHIRVKVQLAEWDVPGNTPAETDVNGNQVKQSATHELHCHVTLTNAPAGVTVFSGWNSDGSAETPVANLAQNIYQSRAVLDYDGEHEIVDPGIAGGASPRIPLAQIIGHWNLLNFSGGNVAWATANMTISGTDIDLMTNHVSISIGPSKHLQPQDWNSMLQFFRYRRVYLPSSVRATGYGGANNTVDMARATPDANTVAGLTVESASGNIGYTTPSDPTSPVVGRITHDAQQGMTVIM